MGHDPFFAISSVISWSDIQSLRTLDKSVRDTHTMLLSLNELFSTLQDAETGQRGFLLTGDEAYLQPYVDAVDTLPARLKAVERLGAGNLRQQANPPYSPKVS